MLVFSTSDKGGTGRSVTSCNIAYRLYLEGKRVAYVDFDLGSPTAGALFEIGTLERGVPKSRGVHSYLEGKIGAPERFNVRRRTDRPGLQMNSPKYGELWLLPGDEGGSEFMSADEARTAKMVDRCRQLLLDLKDEFDVVIIDLSAGRSVALDVALRVTGSVPLKGSVEVRWMVFHRWTRQHILAAAGLVHGSSGILETGVDYGHDREKLRRTIRFVRTAVNDPGVVPTDRPAQRIWLKKQNDELRILAARRNVGFEVVLGETPVEPMLLWREQVILDDDVDMGIAEPKTRDAYRKLATNLVGEASWEEL